jgi:hypothetical protein
LEDEWAQNCEAVVRATVDKNEIREDGKDIPVLRGFEVNGLFLRRV